MRELTLAFLAIGLFIQQMSNIFWTNIDVSWIIIVGLYAVIVSVFERKTKFKKTTFFMGIVQLLLLAGTSVIFITFAPVLTNMGSKITYPLITILLILATLSTLLLLIKDSKNIFSVIEEG